MKNLAYNYDDERWSENTANHIQKTSIRRSVAEGDVSLENHLQLYLLQIKPYPLLKRDEEIELARRVRENDDQDAANRLVTSNLRLVVKIAKNFYLGGSGHLLDLIQEGNLGLLQAARKYNPEHGTKFSYYASFWIKAYMLKYVMSNAKLVKIGTTQKQRKLFFKLAKEKHQMMAEGKYPDEKGLAERLNVTEEDVIEMRQRLEGGEVSLDTPVGDEDGDTYDAFIKATEAAVDDQIAEKEQKVVFNSKIREFRRRLSDREADIFDYRIMSENPVVLREIGDKYQISRERVRQIQKKIVEDIKNWSQQEIPNFEADYSSIGT